MISLILDIQEMTAIIFISSKLISHYRNVYRMLSLSFFLSIMYVCI